MRADEWPRSARRRVWNEQEYLIAGISDDAARIVKVLEITDDDAHYVIGRMWRIFKDAVIVLAIAGVDEEELVRELGDSYEPGHAIHLDLAEELTSS